MWHFFSYSRVRSKDESQEPLYDQGHTPEFLKKGNRLSRQRSITQYFELIVSVAGALFALITLVIIGYWIIKGNHETVYTCGTTPEEAVEKDCQFDMLSFAWVPKPCFDAELSSTYNTYEEFEFFYHREKPDKIPVEELKRGINEHVYTSGRYHRMHCTYAWQVLQRAVIQGFHLSDNKTMNPAHYDHCSYYLIDVDRSYRARFTMEYLHCQKMPRRHGSLLW